MIETGVVSAVKREVLMGIEFAQVRESEYDGHSSGLRRQHA